MGKNIILITIDQVISYATCQSIIGCNMNLHLYQMVSINQLEIEAILDK
jgi:hypothetical protein